MEKQRFSKKIINICIISIIIIVIAFVALMFILHYDVKGETNMRPKVKSYMSNIRNISENATGGIRVRTVAKRKCNGKTKEYVKYDIVRMGNTTSESDPFLFDDFLECSTQISWQNYTGNTRFDAYFIAEQ